MDDTRQRREGWSGLDQKREKPLAGPSFGVSSDLPRRYPKPGHNNMKAQAPELLISTVDLTGQDQGATRQGHTLDEDIKVEQGGDELDHGGLSVDEAPTVRHQQETRKKIFRTQPDQIVIVWRKSPDGN